MKPPKDNEFHELFIGLYDSVEDEDFSIDDYLYNQAFENILKYLESSKPYSITDYIQTDIGSR